jgi:agmatinase
VSSTGNCSKFVYADIPTFAKAPLTHPRELNGVEVAVYGVPWDGTASPRPGARWGPRAIREQSIWFHEVWNPRESALLGFGRDGPRTRRSIDLVDSGDVTVSPGDLNATAKAIRATSAAIAAKAFPVMLGGDHYVTFPAYQGVYDAYLGKRVGIVQIDAHADLVNDDPVLGRHWSATPMRRALEFSGLDPRSLAQIGLRGFIGEQARTFQIEGRVTVIPMPELRELGPDDAVATAFDAVLEHADVVYVTVDIDAVDPSCAPGTCMPVPGGLTSTELLALLRALGARRHIVALDLVEVAPPLDPTQQTQVLAAHALFAFLEEQFLLERPDHTIVDRSG